MAHCSTNEFRAGLKIIYASSPHAIVENEFVKPGKGQAFNRVKLRNLLTGKLTDRTLRSGESFELADVLEQPAQYLYREGDTYHFMNPESFEQFSVAEGKVLGAKRWLLGQELCTVTFWNQDPISVAPPTFVELTVTETDPGLKGDTVSGGTKQATLETGALVRIPLFVQTGERVRIDTRDGSYAARAASPSNRP